MRLIAITSLLTVMLTFGPFPGRDWMPSWVVGNPVLLAAGDIADCGSTGDDVMASLVEQMPGTVATLGDNAYPSGTSEQFAKCYDPTWGRVKWRTRPTPGDHDYGTHGAGPYFAYFGALAGDPDKGYYSYDLGTWHIVALNSNCEKAGGCGPGTAQELWLKADLAAHPAACILAYWHHPLYSSADMLGNNIEVRTFWQDLRAAGADVVLNGHVHNYERFAPQDDRGAADPRGIREFVVGTGGRDHRPTTDIAANSEAHIEDTFGVLKLTLRAGSYDWEFVPEPGKTETDSGSARCDGAANSVATG